jgi:pimeloyl-ACP methyl ester carboxylesterase
MFDMPVKPLRRLGALLLSLGLALGLSACQTISVGEQDLLRSNAALKNPPLAPVFDSAAAQKIWPQATVAEWAVPVAPDLALRALYVQRPEAKATVLFFGGNLYRADDSAAGMLRTWAEAPVNLVLVDHRGHGRSPGEPTIALVADDAVKLYDFVKAQTQGKVLVHGFSLGSFVAGHVAQHRAVDALALTATGTNVPSLIRSQVPWYARPFVSLQIAPPLMTVDNLRAVAQVKAPAAVISGEVDTLTQPAAARQVFDAMPSPTKRWVLVPGAGHNNLLRKPETQEALTALARQLTEVN